MKPFHQFTIQQFSVALAAKKPTPGGGAVAALSAGIACNLLIMVLNYSLGKNTKAVDTRFSRFIADLESYQKELLKLVTEDAKAYEAVGKAKKKSKAEYTKALKGAIAVPKQIVAIIKKVEKMLPQIRKNGNKYLLSDVDVSEYHLEAARKSAEILIKVNQ